VPFSVFEYFVFGHDAPIAGALWQVLARRFQRRVRALESTICSEPALGQDFPLGKVVFVAKGNEGEVLCT
jgi:hypothetical protein